jgi:hypothetical protein
VRRNAFGETYCHSALEVRHFIDAQHDGDWDVYVSSVDPPDAPGEKACAEIIENVSGDHVCFIEADTVDAVLVIIHEVDIEAPRH